MLKFAPLLALFVIGNVVAEQRYPIIEGGAITGYISPAGLNRIVVVGDRITSVKGTAGQFQMDKDPQLGQIFLQPTVVDKGDPIHLFITTEKGNTYLLSLLLHDMGPESIVLVPTEDSAKSEKESLFESNLVNLIRAMHFELPLTGYQIEKGKIAKQRIKNAKVMHYLSFKGEKLKGECYQLKNDSDKELVLEEKDFYQDKVLAIAVLKKSLKAHDKTQVYVVKKHV